MVEHLAEVLHPTKAFQPAEDIAEEQRYRVKATAPFFRIDTSY